MWRGEVWGLGFRVEGLGVLEGCFAAAFGSARFRWGFETSERGSRELGYAGAPTTSDPSDSSTLA